MAWVSLKLFGLSLVGLHLWPALAAWGTVILAGLTAREFGGSRRAQVLAAFTVVAVTLGPDSSSRSSNLSYLHLYFRIVRQAATLSNPRGIKNEYYQGQVWICTRLRHPWAQLWPQLRHYD